MQEDIVINKRALSKRLSQNVRGRSEKGKLTTQRMTETVRLLDELVLAETKLHRVRRMMCCTKRRWRLEYILGELVSLEIFIFSVGLVFCILSRREFGYLRM